MKNNFAKILKLTAVGGVLFGASWGMISCSPNPSAETVVFASGEDGYKSYRIPAIVQLNNGDLLAFCEGRVDGASDFGNIQIVMKRSSDNGKSWSNLQVIASNGTLQVGNPAPVLDTMNPAFPDGELFLFFNTGDASEPEVLKGKGFKQCWYITSTDNGQTWSEPTDITPEVFLANRPDIDSVYIHPEDWRYYANTPGHAIQVKEGPYKGRIYVAANHSEGDPQPNGKHYMAHGFYTDDHGKSFSLSNNIAYPGSNESMAVELSNGKMMMNSRNQQGNIKARIVTLSHDGGTTWEEPTFDMALPDPVCQGSIVSLGEKNGQTILAFCNAADTANRNNLTLRISYDEGKSWSKQQLIYGGTVDPNKNDYAAYSDIVATQKGEVGILYEKDNYSKIVYTTVKP